MTEDEARLKMILAKDAGGVMRLWACRGGGKGCSRNRYRAQSKQCEDCVLAREEETLEQLQTRLAAGDS